jgi:hypothetical protein
VDEMTLEVVLTDLLAEVPSSGPCWHLVVCCGATVGLSSRSEFSKQDATQKLDAIQANNSTIGFVEFKSEPILV